MQRSKILSLLGPGIVWAATSIGVSHIVQATRAGADYGFALIGFILLAHVIKYPFFLMGPRYAAYTGKSLLDGYKSVGNWAFYLFLGLTLVTMFFVQAGVTIVTAALAFNLFGDLLSVPQWAAAILGIVSFVLVVGHYRWLNTSLKWMMLLFSLLCVIALITAISRLGIIPSGQPVEINLTSAASIAFIVALMGWMPTAIEVSVWHSLWTLARFKTFGKASAKIAEKDFNIGFLASLVLAVVFLWIGVLLMFGQSTLFAQSAAAFAGQLVSIYATALGDGSWLLMAAITFIALFSTTFAVSDGFPQVWKRAHRLIAPEQTEHNNKIYLLTLFTLVAGSWWIIAAFAKDIKALLDFVTTVSFVSAPVYAWLNYRVVMSDSSTEGLHPKGLFKIYTLSCLTALTLFSGFFLYWRFA